MCESDTGGANVVGGYHGVAWGGVIVMVVGEASSGGT